MDAFDAERFWKLTAAYELDISYLRNTIQCHRISLLECWAEIAELKIRLAAANSPMEKT